MTDAAEPGNERDGSADLVSVTPGGACGQAFRSTTAEQIAALLGSFRLLEAAGACELIATTADRPVPPDAAGGVVEGRS